VFPSRLLERGEVKECWVERREEGQVLCLVLVERKREEGDLPLVSVEREGVDLLLVQVEREM
jgi:hypothetical protein